MDMEFIKTLISSVVGGLLVAIVNHLLTRKRYEAETRKLEAEINKVKAETEKSVAETEKIRSEARHDMSAASYLHDSANESVLYDSRKDFHGYDIVSDLWEVTSQNNVIMIRESSAHFQLRTYLYAGKEYTFIPKNELISGYRKIHISCEMKVIDASYEVAMYMMEEPDLEGHSIDDRDLTITETEWTKADYYLRAFPHKNYLVYIGVERTSGQGSLQIRNLVVTERVS